MAILFPPPEVIDRMKVKPTEGESHLLAFLSRALDDTFEIFFQPYLNGDNPDVIVMRRGSGVLIIEVKDWHLDSYKLDERKNWGLRNVVSPSGRNQVVKSPLHQVYDYKENLYNLHIDGLVERRIRNPKCLSVVTCCVYFYNASRKGIDSLLKDDFRSDERYLKYLSHFELIGRDDLTEGNFVHLLHRRWLDRRSLYFDDELYGSIWSSPLNDWTD